MQQIIKELIEKAGLTEEQASKSITVLKEYIQGKLPPGFGALVDNFLGKSATAATEESNGFFDKMKDGAEDLADKTKETLDAAADKAENLAENAADMFQQFMKDANEKGDDMLDKLKGMFGKKD